MKTRASETRFVKLLETLYSVGMSPGGMVAFLEELKGPFKSHTQFATLAINRDQRRGPYRESELALARRLLPHVRNVYRLQRQLSWIESMTAGFRAALDGLECGVCLIDRRGSVVFSNCFAQQLFASDFGIRQVGSQLRATWAPDRNRLRIALDRASMGAVADAPNALAIHDSNGVPVTSILLAPLPSATCSDWSEPRAAAIAFMKPIRSHLRPSAERLQSIFRLTAAEARLASRLLAGATVEEASKQLGKSINTLRSQLRALFNKTHTRRQSELLRTLERAS